MNFKIKKIGPDNKVRFEVRAWDGSGDNRTEWKRRFDSKKEAQDFIDESVFRERETRENLRRNGGDQNSIRTFGEEYQYWRTAKYVDLAPGWRNNIDQYWRDFGPRLSELKVKEINPALLRELEHELRERKNSRSTIKRKIGWIQSILNFAVQMERIPYSPIARYRTAKPSKPDLQFWEKEEAISFLEFALAKYPKDSSAHWKYLVYLVALNTAARGSEIWSMKPVGMKKSLGLIHLTEQFSLAEGSFRGLKGKEARNVPLSKDLESALEDWIRSQDIKPTGLLFTAQGSPVDHNNFAKRIFHSDIKEWGGKRIKFHGLRHTAATLMLDAGVDIRTVQEILGHKNLETTLRYVHALGQNVRRAASTFSLTPKTADVVSLAKIQLVK